MKMPMRLIITFLVATMSIAVAGPSFAGKKKHHSSKSDKSDKSHKSDKSKKSGKGNGHGHDHGDGSVGPAGPAGADGTDGADGADGATGPAGADGIAGADGVAGPAGATGPIGLTGAIGPQGLDGIDGIDGVDGSSGVLTSSVVEGVVRTFGGEPGNSTSEAFCAPGFIASGGGFALMNTGSTPGAIIESAPTGGSPPTAWRVMVSFSGSSSVGQSFRAYAVCYEEGDDPNTND